MSQGYGLIALQVSDLAAGSKQTPLGVRHDKNRGFFVEGLTEQPCATCQDALVFMHKGLTTRHIRSVLLTLYVSCCCSKFCLQLARGDDQAVMKTCALHKMVA